MEYVLYRIKLEELRHNFVIGTCHLDQYVCLSPDKKYKKVYHVEQNPSVSWNIVLPVA